MYAIYLSICGRAGGYWTGHIHRFGFDHSVLIPNVVSTPDTRYMQLYESLDEVQDSVSSLVKQLSSDWAISVVDIGEERKISSTVGSVSFSFEK